MSDEACGHRLEVVLADPAKRRERRDESWVVFCELPADDDHLHQGRIRWLSGMSMEAER